MRDIQEQYDVDPQEVIENLEDPELFRGNTKELYRKANDLFDSYSETMANALKGDVVEAKELHEAMYDLEQAERFLEQAEIEICRRDGPHTDPKYRVRTCE